MLHTHMTLCVFDMCVLCVCDMCAYVCLGVFGWHVFGVFMCDHACTDGFGLVVHTEHWVPDKIMVLYT